MCEVTGHIRSQYKPSHKYEKTKLLPLLFFPLYWLTHQVFFWLYLAYFFVFFWRYRYILKINKRIMKENILFSLNSVVISHPSFNLLITFSCLPPLLFSSSFSKANFSTINHQVKKLPLFTFATRFHLFKRYNNKIF